jgi:hypothetical protein
LQAQITPERTYQLAEVVKQDGEWYYRIEDGKGNFGSFMPCADEEVGRRKALEALALHYDLREACPLRPPGSPAPRNRGPS